MELREFAEHVLYGQTLEAKLLAPGPARDEDPGPAREAPRRPGRPRFLQLERPGGSRPRPGRRELERPDRRATVLHAFANHELLAVELMALTLLRFPEAPPGFRREIFHAMTQEQAHLRAYLRRMEALGVGFGDLPVNGFFWDRLVDMSHPRDFVARMSLTFEQANLDFAAWFRDELEAIGDDVTAGLMQRVYRDEIEHVALGVRWFDAWRPVDSSRYDAWRRVLGDDLSPARARGRGFDERARVAAGLDQPFIDAVRVFGWRPGAQGALHVPNLDAEAELSGTTLPRAARRVAEDLGPLLAHVAPPHDVVLAAHVPAPSLRRTWHELGLPTAHVATDAHDLPVRVSRLTPWAATPGIERQARALGLSTPEAGPTRTWHAKDRQIPLARALWRQHPQLCGPVDGAGEVVTDPEVLHAHIARGAPVAVRAPWSVSGSGLVRVRQDDEAACRAAKRTLARHGCVVVAPWRARRLDLAMLMDIGEDDIEVQGPLVCLVNRLGRSEGHVRGPWGAVADPQLVRFLHASHPSGPRPLDVLEAAARQVAERLQQDGFRGRAGIDAFVHELDDQLLLAPLVEVNARTTLGHVSAAVFSRLAPGTSAAVLHVRGTGIAAHVARARTVERELRDGRLVLGVLPLVDPDGCRAVCPFLWVAPSPDALREILARFDHSVPRFTASNVPTQRVS